MVPSCISSQDSYRFVECGSVQALVIESAFSDSRDVTHKDLRLGKVRYRKLEALINHVAKTI